MAAGGFIDLTKFTFDGTLLSSISQMLFDETIKLPEFRTLHTVFTGIVTDTEVGYIGEGGLVGVKDTGCGSTAKTWNVNTRAVTWSPETWEIFLQQCYTDLENAMTVYSLNTGVRIPDFTDTDYMAVVVMVLRKSIQEFFYRLVWFNDTATTSTNLTSGTDDDYFNIIDGFWKQMITQATTNSAQRVTITENAGGSYEAQKLTVANVPTYLNGLVFGAPIELRGSSDQFILCTQSFYDAYLQYLTSAATLESARTMLMDGREALSFNGVPVIPMPVWDKTIAAYYDNGTKLDNPHRAVYTNRAVLGVGVDSLDSFDEFDIWYDKSNKKVNIRLMGKADAKLTNPNMFMIAI